MPMMFYLFQEFVSGCVICLLNILYLVQVSKSASDVGGEACAGLEVVRRKTMLGRKVWLFEGCIPKTFKLPTYYYLIYML